MNASALHLPALRARFRRLLKSPGKRVGEAEKIGFFTCRQTYERLPPPRPPTRINVVYVSYRRLWLPPLYKINLQCGGGKEIDK